MELAQEQKIAYSIIIDSILKGSDLTSISAKQVRKQLAAQLGRDITDQKIAVNALIDERFDAVSDQVIENVTNGSETQTNGVMKSIEPATAVPSNGLPVTAHSSESITTKAAPRSPPATKRSAYSDGSELSEVRDSPAPQKKRKKNHTSTTTAEEDDAAFAARLQDEENRRARPTRGGATRKRAPAKSAAKKKKKSSARVKDEDDSGLSSGDEAPKERKGGFHKPMLLSQPLSDLLGETALSRPQTVKKIWEYIKSQDLQDPNDKRQIRCDDAMRAVFKSDRVHMFTMNKILNQNLYAQDE